MMISTTTTYQAAQMVSETIEKHFIFHHQIAVKHDGKILAPIPNSLVIESIIDVGFWASLRREEGRSPKISLAFLPPSLTESPLIFEHRLKFNTDVLTKLAPSVEHAGIHLGVWIEDDELYIWGTTTNIPGLCFVLEVVEPGLLVIKHRRTDGFGKFINVAVLKGDQIKVIDESSGTLPDCPAVLGSMIGIASPSSWNDSLNVLVQLAVAMRAHQRGGALLIVPSKHDNWRSSIIYPITYALRPVFSGLSFLNEKGLDIQNPALQNKLNQAINGIAGLTAVDGATIINDQFEVLAFGAKIGRSPSGKALEAILVTEPIVGNEPQVVHPVQNGGTRHLSAAQFVYDQRDAIALVASQDGRFTIFSWSPCDRMVHAHRVDTLLI
ncbi:hypothetical protein VB264_16065 [Arcicella aquatica]|uniref:Probable sensor domain-containing protein n=1 Tax=Arcicella aquatica TaxID=217141 RepID=A0ABU5QRE4_9BACT|nr:hypothetical protein [Arcicella aquatica]MEA5259314.1 hypothetical protein [Arcicella aquatica]